MTTLPRDGTPVLLLSPEGHVGIGMIRDEGPIDDDDGLKWTSEHAAWTGKRRGERAATVWLGGCRATEATGWQPLPPA